MDPDDPGQEEKREDFKIAEIEDAEGTRCAAPTWRSAADR
jgi:hypothetical protein